MNTNLNYTRGLQLCVSSFVPPFQEPPIENTRPPEVVAEA